MSNFCPNQKGSPPVEDEARYKRRYRLGEAGFAPILIIFGLLILGGAIGGAYYLGISSKPSTFDSKQINSTNESSDSATMQSQNESNLAPHKSAYEILKSRNAPGYSSSNAAPSPSSSVSTNKIVPQVAPPESYGYTKLMELPVIGLKARFPKDTTLYLTGNQMYSAKIESDIVSFSLESYDGGGRRAWFQKNHGSAVDTFETSSGKNNNGYIGYYKNGIGNNSPGLYYYFTSVGSDKMLVVTGFNAPGRNNFFGGDREKLKSFISTVELTSPVDPYPDGIKITDYNRWSDKRKIVWEDSTLGLKVTSPEWSDYRNTSGRNVDGTYNFGEWKRNYFETSFSEGSFTSSNYPASTVYFAHQYTSSYISIIKNEFRNQDFNDLVYSTLFPAGFCTTEWKSSKSECTNPNGDYCYTKEEVIQSLILVESRKIGELGAQLRGLEENFNYNNDCRSEKTWVIKAKDGRFVLTDMSPDGEILRIESN